METVGQPSSAEGSVSAALPAEVTKRLGPIDGVDFELSRRGDTLLMRRRSHDDKTGLVEHCILFDNLDGFGSWLDEDPVVRSRPLLNDQLKRLARELLERAI